MNSLILLTNLVLKELQMAMATSKEEVREEVEEEEVEEVKTI